MEISRIVVPTDLSDESRAALGLAVELARNFRADLFLLTVLDFEAYVSALPPLQQQQERIKAQLKDKVHAELERLRIDALGEDLPVHVAVAEGHGAAPAICDYARDHGTDLIVMSTHGRTGVRHAMLGSVTERVVRSAPCAVLTVHAAT